VNLSLRATPFPQVDKEGKKNTTKGSWVEIRTGKDHSPVTLMDKTGSTQGKLFNLSPIKSE